MAVRDKLSRIIAASPFQYIPVKVLAGPAKGAKWTLGPFSANWRLGGEGDVRAALLSRDNWRGKVFWDFGAHFGIHTVGVSMALGPSGQVVAFEPDPRAFSRLSRHVRMNRLGNVVLYQMAASSSERSEQLYLPGGLGTSNSHLKYADDHDMAGKASVQVATCVPDLLVARGAIRLPDLIKVDVQGHGDQVIEGCRESISAALPLIVFSNHSPKELGGARQVLEPMGYKPVKADGRAIGWADENDFLIIPPSGAS